METGVLNFCGNLGWGTRNPCNLSLLWSGRNFLNFAHSKGCEPLHTTITNREKPFPIFTSNVSSCLNRSINYSCDASKANRDAAHSQKCASNITALAMSSRPESKRRLIMDDFRFLHRAFNLRFNWTCSTGSFHGRSMLQLDDAFISNRKTVGMLRTMSSRAKRYNQENVRLVGEGQLVFLSLARSDL